MHACNLINLTALSSFRRYEDVILVVIGSTRNEEDRRLLQTLRDEAAAGLALNRGALSAAAADDSVLFIVDQVRRGTTQDWSLLICNLIPAAAICGAHSLDGCRMHRAAQHVERALRDIRGGDASGRAGGRRSPLRGAEDGHHPTRSKRCD